MINTTDSKLRTLLDAKGITPADFARMMELRPQTVHNWIARGVPHSKAFLVAKVLGVDISEVSQGESQIKAVSDKQTTPKTVEEYLALYGDQWRDLPVQELTKLMSKLSDRIAEAVKNGSN